MKINLLDYFEKTVDLYPNKLACYDSLSELSFLELRSAAVALASKIDTISNSMNQPIVVFLPKSNAALIAMLASLYSGNCYVPLDTSNPPNRIETILQSLNPVIIITNSIFYIKLRQCNPNCPIINMDSIDLTFQNPVCVTYKACIDNDPAYIIYTSGSTGVPKGVIVSHRSIIDYVNWAIETFSISALEKIGNQAPFIFDNSTLDIYLMLFTGATLYIIPERFFMFPVKLLDFLILHDINFIFWVPSVLINVSNFKLLDNYSLPALKKVLFAGEVMPTKHLNYWIQNFDTKVIFANLYGPTEITVDCTFYIVNRSFRDDEKLPIGKPCRNTDVLILNKNDKVCSKGENGELCVRGSSLALGYWNDINKTNSVFVQNPLNTAYNEKIYRTGDVVYLDEDDEIYFVGRKDQQIKHRGYRIELGEIEHHINSVFLTRSCVLYDKLNNDIVLFYETKETIETQELRKKIVSVLPKYMMPTRFIKMSDVPLTSGGKIDRAYLKTKIYTKQ